MNLSQSQRDKIKALVDRSILKAEDRPDLKKELQEISDKMSEEGKIVLPVSINRDDLEYATSVVGVIESAIERYVKFTDVNDIDSLEAIKREISINLMYLSSFKDKFLYELEYIEDVFKKEIFAQLTSEISLAEGVSYTQAEKKVNADPRYCELRKEITDLKKIMGGIKTKYDFFGKMIQVIVQSISVAGKEQYSSRVSS